MAELTETADVRETVRAEVRRRRASGPGPGPGSSVLLWR